jgi:hypothetical protein
LSSNSGRSNSDGRVSTESWSWEENWSVKQQRLGDSADERDSWFNPRNDSGVESENVDWVQTSDGVVLLGSDGDVCNVGVCESDSSSVVVDVSANESWICKKSSEGERKSSETENEIWLDDRRACGR